MRKRMRAVDVIVVLVTAAVIVIVAAVMLADALGNLNHISTGGI